MLGRAASRREGFGAKLGAWWAPKAGEVPSRPASALSLRLAPTSSRRSRSVYVASFVMAVLPSLLAAASGLG